MRFDMRENIFACLLSVHNTTRLLRHEQVCLIRLRSRDTSPIIGTISIIGSEVYKSNRLLA